MLCVFFAPPTVVFSSAFSGAAVSSSATSSSGFSGAAVSSSATSSSGFSGAAVSSSATFSSAFSGAAVSSSAASVSCSLSLSSVYPMLSYVISNIGVFTSIVFPVTTLYKNSNLSSKPGIVYFL